MLKDFKDKAPQFSSVIKNPADLISTFFGVGCITPAPGTWGSFAAWLAFWLLSYVCSHTVLWVLTAVLFFLGVWSIPQSGERFGKVDHGSIVIDEVVAVWIILLVIPQTFWWQLAGVIVFRFFDILKLPPASTIDRLKQNGWTVMVDDLFAAVYALCILTAVWWYL